MTRWCHTVPPRADRIRGRPVAFQGGSVTFNPESTSGVLHRPARGAAINPFEEMASRFDQAARLLKLDAGLCKVLREPIKEVKVAIPVIMDDGRIELFIGYRVITTSPAGPQRAESATTRRCLSTKCARSPRG